MRCGFLSIFFDHLLLNLSALYDIESQYAPVHPTTVGTSHLQVFFATEQWALMQP